MFDNSSRGTPRCAGGRRALSVSAALLIGAGGAWAAPTAPGAPDYDVTFDDAVTGDAAPTRSTTATTIGQVNYAAAGNGGRFTNSGGQVSFDVDQFQPGSVTQRADHYLNETYERPTDQTYFNQADTGANVRFGLDPGGVKYYGYLDIERARVGFDANYLYVSIDLFSRNSVTTGAGTSNGENKLQGFYGFRIGASLADPQSRSGYFVRFENPTDKATTSFALNATASVFADVNDNVGGNSINGSEASTAEGGDVTGDGYEVQVVADGKTNGNGGFTSNQNALYTRVDPLDDTRVEFAFDYNIFGFTQADLTGANLFLLFQATEIRNDAGDPFFNDHYNYAGAGTPNPDLRGVAGTVGPNSAYQTTGLSGNIYRLDTLHGGAIPEPATLSIGAAVGGFILMRRRVTRATNGESSCTPRENRSRTR